jgi:hypothetical protein
MPTLCGATGNKFISFRRGLQPIQRQSERVVDTARGEQQLTCTTHLAGQHTIDQVLSNALTHCPCRSRSGKHTNKCQQLKQVCYKRLCAFRFSRAAERKKKGQTPGPQTGTR